MNLFNHFLTGEKVYTQFLSPVCGKYGLTYMELTVLLFLANNPELDTASHIVRCRNLTKSHVSLSVRSLSDKGLLTGTYQAGDRRTIHLKPTQKASEIIADGRAAQRDFMEVVISGISPEELNVLSSLMEKMDRNISDYFTSHR